MNDYYLQIWWSMIDGFVVDIYPLFQMQISNTLIATVIGIAIALRITKKIRSRKRKLK